MTEEQKKKIVKEFNEWVITEYGKMHTVEYNNPDPINWWISKIDEAVRSEQERIINEITSVPPQNMHEFLIRGYFIEEMSRIIG